MREWLRELWSYPLVKLSLPVLWITVILTYSVLDVVNPDRPGWWDLPLLIIVVPLTLLVGYMLIGLAFAPVYIFWRGLKSMSNANLVEYVIVEHGTDKYIGTETEPYIGCWRVGENLYLSDAGWEITDTGKDSDYSGRMWVRRLE